MFLAPSLCFSTSPCLGVGKPGLYIVPGFNVPRVFGMLHEKAKDLTSSIKYTVFYVISLLVIGYVQSGLGKFKNYHE